MSSAARPIAAKQNPARVGGGWASGGRPVLAEGWCARSTLAWPPRPCPTLPRSPNLNPSHSGQAGSGHPPGYRPGPVRPRTGRTRGARLGRESGCAGRRRRSAGVLASRCRRNAEARRRSWRAKTGGGETGGGGARWAGRMKLTWLKR